jgi:tRNA (guanine-N7-)-methyltransferase
METNQSKSGPRPIRSFVIRSGRLTSSQRKAMEAYGKDYLIDYQDAPLPIAHVFANQADTVLEIGFGMGDSLLEMAQQSPDKNFLGIEVHLPGIGKVLQGIANAGLQNLQLINYDAKEVLENCIENESFTRIQIYFPDPWHKKRHNKRRLIQPDFVELLMSKLKPAGELHLATDWQPYAEHMLEVLDSNNGLKNSAGAGNYADASQRVQTKFERRGLKLGHGVWDLIFVKA